MNKIEELEKEFENLVNEFEKKLEDLKKRFDECENSQKVNKRWRAEEGQWYFYIENFLEVDKNRDVGDSTDNMFYKIHNYFKTEEEAEKVVEKIKIYVELKDLAEELNAGQEIDWDNEYQAKRIIYKDFECKKLDDNCVYEAKDIGQIYCLNKDFLEIAIERIGEERLLKLFE